MTEVPIDFEREYAVSVTMTASRSKGFANVAIVTPDGQVIGYISSKAWRAFMDAVTPVDTQPAVRA